jgi:hypothetical protein
LPDEGAFEIGGDTVTQAGSRFLASVCAGDLTPIKNLILNRNANGYCRGQALEALAILVAWRELPHKQATDYFIWLAREGLERTTNEVWSDLAAACVDIEALPAFPEIRRAFDEGFIEEEFIERSELEEVEFGPRGSRLADFRERNPHITDVACETSWWSCYENDPILKAEREELRRRLDTELGNEESDSLSRGTPYRAPVKIGRNDPCPCGSGKKYKKCCGKSA